MPTASEDRDEILQLLYRYNHTIDGGEPEAWADLFTPDGVFEAFGRVTTGRDDLVTFAVNVTPGLRHVISNPVVDVEGDTAHVAAYLMIVREKAVMTVGVYQDDLVRVDGGWRFTKRVFSPDA